MKFRRLLKVLRPSEIDSFLSFFIKKTSERGGEETGVVATFFERDHEDLRSTDKCSEIDFTIACRTNLDY